MLSYRVMALGLAAFLLAPPSWGAETPQGLLRVSCPAIWPGPEHQGEKLTWANNWIYGGENGPDAPLVPPEYDTQVELDCAYGYLGSKAGYRGGFSSPLRLTVAVPGHAKRCDGPLEGHNPRWCDTAPEADGTIGPILIYVAQRVTLDTTFLGFSLRQDKARISSFVETAGFHCAETAADVLECTRNEDRVAVHFVGGRSFKIEMFLPKTVDSWTYATHRFGLHMDFVGSKTEGQRWLTPGQPAVVSRSNVDLRLLTLLDTEAAGKGP